MNQPIPFSRRDVLRTTGTAALAGALAPLVFSRSRGRGEDVLRVGLVGCGGRGTGAAANALAADPATELVALGDVFADHLENSLSTLQRQSAIAERVRVDQAHRFVGFDAFQKVVDSVDVVLLATSPHFRPQHMAYAVERGKHLFVEKPVATDAPGVRSVLESARLAAQQGLSVVSGLCYRYSKAKRETVKRIQQGALGKIVALKTSYDTGGLWHRGRQPEWSEMEYQIRNWLYFTWLSGDHIAEQHIHSLDKLAWVMGGYPVECKSSGGRIVRTDEKYGNVYDHFNTVYKWADGVEGFSSCRQWVGASTDVSDWIFGSEGRAELQKHEILPAQGRRWRYESDEDDDMYQQEHDALFAAIRSGQPINDGETMAHSTLMAIMGRMSAYTGQKVTWEETLGSQLDLSPPAYEWGPLEMRPVARPGVTKFL